MDKYSFENLGDGCELCVSHAHRFGTDAFVLADFAGARHKDIVCDLGTGCGIIAVLMKLRYHPDTVYGIDIQQEAIAQLKITISRSCLDGIIPICMDLKNLDPPAPLEKCDVVVCNPPYKAAGAGIESGLEAHRIARHEVMCSLGDVCAAAARLLKFGGRLCICSRPERLADAVSAMRENGIEPKRLRFVSKDSATAPWLFLMEGRKGGKPFMKVMEGLYMGSGGISPQLRKIYGREGE